jgi:hypothetical protein
VKDLESYPLSDALQDLKEVHDRLNRDHRPELEQLAERVEREYVAEDDD